MRINKVSITKYKNLENFKIDFSNSYYVSILLGKNGTGKSNLLEFLTIVFKCLDLSDSPAKFKELYTKELRLFNVDYTDFELEYSINNNIVRFILKNNKLKIRDIGRTANIPFSQFKSKEENLFPAHVVGYSSGKNRRFEDLFDTHIDNAENLIVDIRNAYYRAEQLNQKALEEGVAVPEEKRVEIPVENFRKLFFAGHRYSQLLLLTLFAFRQNNSAIDTLLKDCLKIDGFERFSVTLKSPGFNSTISLDDGIEKFWGVEGSSLKCASFLYRISKRSLRLSSEQTDVMNISSTKKEAITFLVDADKFISSVGDEFNNNESDTFRYLESLFLSDLLQDIVLDVKRAGDVISFSNLSEGEQQMISTLGLMIITGKKNSLYLMDEPDTHLNPKWQRDYVSIIKKLVEGNDNSHVLIATHSPFIPQSIKSSDLILLKQEEGKTIVHKIDNMHTWKIDQILTSEIYELETTRAADIENMIVRRDEILSYNRKLNKEEREELQQIEESIENIGIGRNAAEVKLNERMRKLADIFEKVDGQ